jgi:hypothetical protein
MIARFVLAAAASVTVVTTAAAQEDLVARGAPLAQRIAAVRQGTVRLSYALRPGVCGQGTSIRTSRTNTMTWSDDARRNRDVEWDDDCESGPGRLALDVQGGEIRALRFYVGGRWRAASAGEVTDLGTVPAAQAAGLLLGIAERAIGKPSRDAVFPSTLADSATTWPVLLRLARDDRVAKETRSQAVFWVSSAAGDAATRGLVELTNDPDRELRDQAVFALSRRPADEGVPALIKVARTSRDPQLRRSAMFWLGRSNDPRALALFEELLTSK